jgi:hypothetical protein
MSYCRWSSEDFKCDVYAYEHCYGGYTTHVAGNRTVGEIPKVDWNADTDILVAQHRAQMAFLETCERKDITLPHAGETFNDATLEEFRARLIGLKALGYHIPEYVFEQIDAEIAEAA